MLDHGKNMTPGSHSSHGTYQGVIFFPRDTSKVTFFPWDTFGVIFFPWGPVGGCVNLRAPRFYQNQPCYNKCRWPNARNSIHMLQNTGGHVIPMEYIGSCVPPWQPSGVTFFPWNTSGVTFFPLKNIPNLITSLLYIFSTFQIAN